MKIRKVLIVDDDQITREQIAIELKRHYCDTFLAANGAEGMEIFIKEDISILFLDVNLPDINGLDFLKQIKAAKPTCEVIMITGFGSEEIAIQSLRRGAIDYLEKPVNFDTLAAAFGRALEKISQNEDMVYKNTVLVIDDDESARILLKRFLDKEDYEVFIAASGPEGLEIIEKNKIDVLITDINLGEMNGIEVLQQAKKFHPDIEGIVITGQKDEALAIESLRAGASDYINKPINLDELLISLQKAVENITLNRTRLYRTRELKISSEIMSKMNEELERRIEDRSRELSQTQAQLFQTSKLATLGEMSAGLAHEINQPLGGIALICTNMKKFIERGKSSDSMILKDIADIEKSITRITRVINHMRTFARQDALKFISVDVVETINSALTLMGEQLRLHEVEVVQDFDNDIPKIIGEPFQIEQVWINLISNARDSMDEKGMKIQDGRIPFSGAYQKKLTIKVACDAARENLQIFFTDTGMGISDEKKKKIFEPFFTTKEVGKGSGLGLSITYGIIESHLGKIEAQGPEGEGVTFVISFPLNKKEQDFTGGGSK
ncbi:MAG: response regulator [Candidatus Omnitrophica bacterium]|nr:response regulator [Candidatus Omnitrophota bacterium]